MIIYLGLSQTSRADPRLFQEAQNILDPQASWVPSYGNVMLSAQLLFSKVKSVTATCEQLRAVMERVWFGEC